MSILPLGETSADRPGLDYQARLNAQIHLPQLVRGATPNPELAGTGWFTESWGPSGICPVQFMGILQNGEFVYFRARGKTVELTIAPAIDDAPHARYSQTVSVPQSELGAGDLSTPFCLSFIKRHLQDYLARCKSPQDRYSEAPYSVHAPDQVVTI